MDEYYSSEVDKDALMVTRANHGDSIVQIGDVQLLTSKSQVCWPYCVLQVLDADGILDFL